MGGPRPFLMVDGGMTVHSNPAFLPFLIATVEPYNLGWPTGRERMLLVSIGKGTSPKADEDLAPEDMHLLDNAGSVPSALMYGALNEQDMLCRVFDCRYGAPLDLEIGDLIGARGPADPKLFTHVRDNAELAEDWLGRSGLSHIQPRHVQPLDSTEHMAESQEVSRTVAGQVEAEHAGF